jgi:hypothetical protein
MIPKIIHYCWLSGDDYPPLVAKCIASWKKLMPEYEIVLWDLKKIGEEQNIWVQQAYQAKKYAFAADFIRLYAVYHYGGIYLDSDVEVTQSFDALLEQRSFIGFESTGDVEPAVFGAEPHCGWVKYCLDYYKNRIFFKEDGSFDQKPLPVIVKQHLDDYFSIKIEPTQNKPQKVSPELIIFPCDFFSPMNYHTKKIRITPRTMAIHHFDGNWVGKTILNKTKVIIHRLIYALVGEGGHYRLIKLIRKLND